MTPLRFEAARRCVIERVYERRKLLPREQVALECAAGRVLAADIHADRSYPAFPRSIRDGYAVNAAGFNGRAHIAGEVRAGGTWPGEVDSDAAVEIMTGAPMPSGTNAVIMIEHADRDGDQIVTTRTVNSGDFVNPPGSECCAGERVLAAGSRIDFAATAVLATVGAAQVDVYRKPRVTIIATGDELIPIGERPVASQIRNSNSYSLAVQVARCGGIPTIAPVARDNYDATRKLIEMGLQSDLLLLSGGVSAGKYDIVEQVLLDLGAEFFFDRALIQPGQPVVFGRAADTFCFGLPGNPASTMVTFEIFARPALELIAGAGQPELRTVLARLTRDFRHKPGLTRFLPGCLDGSSPSVTPVKYNGSGDVFALGRANCFFVAPDDRESWSAGDVIEVLPR